MINGACIKCESKKQKELIVSYLVHTRFGYMRCDEWDDGDWVVAKCYHEKVVTTINHSHIADCILCENAADFIAQVRRIAKIWQYLEYGNYLLPDVLHISNLPHYLRILAWCRCIQSDPIVIRRDDDYLKRIHISRFCWAETTENGAFWSSILFRNGTLPQLSQALFLFDIERSNMQSDTHRIYKTVMMNAIKLSIHTT